MSAPGAHATPEGTRAFAARHAGEVAADFYGEVEGLALASIGLGTYLGDSDAATDRGYEEAVAAALAGGINHFDTAINYRGMASERALGRALRRAFESGAVAREAVLVATKGGYVPQDAHVPAEGGRRMVDALVRAGRVPASEVAGGSHCLAPGYLEAMLAKSRANLGLATVDVYYLHNPEAQLAEGVAPEAFYERCLRAFETLERARERGEVRWYGTATWSGYRAPPSDPRALSLERMIAAARAAGGDAHGFRFVQLPVNLRGAEALEVDTQRVAGEAMPLLEAARRLGVHVVASGSIAQASLARSLPSRVSAIAWPAAARSNVQRALLWTRSVPGVACALCGMARAAHVQENLGAARAPRVPMR